MTYEIVINSGNKIKGFNTITNAELLWAFVLYSYLGQKFLWLEALRLKIALFLNNIWSEIFIKYYIMQRFAFVNKIICSHIVGCGHNVQILYEKDTFHFMLRVLLQMLCVYYKHPGSVCNFWCHKRVSCLSQKNKFRFREYWYCRKR